MPPPLNTISSPKPFPYRGSWFDNTFSPKSDADGRDKVELRNLTVDFLKISLLGYNLFLFFLQNDSFYVNYHKITRTYAFVISQARETMSFYIPMFIKSLGLGNDMGAG